jgi:hypothetical protein
MLKIYRESLKTRPVKICTSCKEPIINPSYYKSNVHTTGIKGVLSECQKMRNSYYKKHIYSYVATNRYIKKPKGLHNRFNIQSERACLKCNDKFKSKSLHNRVCEKCKDLQPDIISFRNMSLETQNIKEIIYGD